MTFGDSVYVFAGVQGTPTAYEDYNLRNAADVSYDSDGSILMDGEYQSKGNVVVELPFGSSTFRVITLRNIQGNTSYAPIMWDGKFLDYSIIQRAGSSHKSRTVIYRLKISGTTATIKGKVHLALQRGAEYPQFWVQDSVVVQPSNKVRTHSFFESFQYPSGKVIERVNLSGPDDIWGAVISVAPSGSHVRK